MIDWTSFNQDNPYLLQNYCYRLHFVPLPLIEDKILSSPSLRLRPCSPRNGKLCRRFLQKKVSNIVMNFLRITATIGLKFNFLYLGRLLVGDKLGKMEKRFCLWYFRNRRHHKKIGDLLFLKGLGFKCLVDWSEVGIFLQDFGFDFLFGWKARVNPSISEFTTSFRLEAKYIPLGL